jgi:hypothetical protein
MGRDYPATFVNPRAKGKVSNAVAKVKAISKSLSMKRSVSRLLEANLGLRSG